MVTEPVSFYNVHGNGVDTLWQLNSITGTQLFLYQNLYIRVLRHTPKAIHRCQLHNHHTCLHTGQRNRLLGYKGLSGKVAF